VIAVLSWRLNCGRNAFFRQQFAANKTGQRSGEYGPEDEQDTLRNGLLELAQDGTVQLGLDFGLEEILRVALDVLGHGRREEFPQAARQGGFQGGGKRGGKKTPAHADAHGAPQGSGELVRPRFPPA